MKVINRLEVIYGLMTSYLFRSVNPLKKIVIKTEGKVHKFNNQQAVLLLKRHGYQKEFYLFKYYLLYLNLGSVWADQDFKSSGHFYHPILKKGLFGQPHSKKLAQRYYKKAKYAWKKKHIEQGMFYLGACVHIIQDLTVPHHVVIRLLDRHRAYETFVKGTYDRVKAYRTQEPPLFFSDFNKYIEYNARQSLDMYKKYQGLKDRRLKFHKYTEVALPLSHRTTAGCLITFLKDVGFYSKSLD